MAQYTCETDRHHENPTTALQFVTFISDFQPNTTACDLQLTVEHDPPMPWVVGQVGETRLRVTNLSTTLIARARVNFLFDPFAAPYSGPPRDEFATLVFFLQNCPLDPECQRFGQICLEVGTIAPGESRFCYSRLRAIRKRDVPQLSNWVAHHFENQATDPNLTNNTVTIISSIAAAPVPVPLSPWAKSLLVLALMAFGSVQLRNR